METHDVTADVDPELNRDPELSLNPDQSYDHRPEPEPEVEAAADEPRPEVPDPPRTGDPEVDAALAVLATSMGGPLEEQLAVYEAAHRTLQDRLADVEG